ncbi:MAG: hypothetical protein KA149_01305 [Chitinophagales bacterium]|nr:hypothetical protein [Chitinophagales bacterium]
MPCKRIILGLWFVLSILIARAQAEDDVVFRVKQASETVRGTAGVLNYIAGELLSNGQVAVADSYKLFLFRDEMRFQYRRKLISKGAPPISIETIPINFKAVDNYWALLMPDSIVGDQKFKVFNLAANSKTAKPVKWLGILHGSWEAKYDYSVCTDTSAFVVIDSVIIPCYKIESFENYKEGESRGHIKATTYVSKGKLLPVKQITENTCSRIHKPRQYTREVRRQLKKTRTFIFSVTNWL